MPDAVEEELPELVAELVEAPLFVGLDDAPRDKDAILVWVEELLCDPVLVEVEELAALLVKDGSLDPELVGVPELEIEDELDRVDVEVFVSGRVGNGVRELDAVSLVLPENVPVPVPVWLPENDGVSVCAV